jgi:Phage integrase family
VDASLVVVDGEAIQFAMEVEAVPEVGLVQILAPKGRRLSIRHGQPCTMYLLERSCALRFHDIRHLAGTLMSEGGVPPKRAQEIPDHAGVRTTLAIYTHAMRRKHDDSADRMAELARLAPVGNKWETNGSVKDEKSELSACFNGSPGWNRIGLQAIEL